MKQLQLALLLGAVLAAGSVLAGGDGPIIEQHLDQAAIESGDLDFGQIFDKGRQLFVAKFNQYDGQGRPATTGGGAPREPGLAPHFLRTSGPDSNACSGCHNDPFIGGGGDFVANVFVLAQTLDPVTFSVAPEFSNERNTLGMQGSGAIEMLSREMTAELQAARQAGLDRAAISGQEQTVVLRAKGVDFGSLVARADGSVDASGVEGIDADLVLRPFHQKGVVVSLREFTVNAMNHHHGMQAVERFGAQKTGTADFDQDGVEDELSFGDITATAVFQAALAVPGQVLPAPRDEMVAVLSGERIFDRIGCADCHTPKLPLDSRMFVEPSPYNPSNTAGPAQIGSYAFDLTAQGELPRLEPLGNGRALVRAYTDLKRHNLCDDEIRHYCNEQVIQAGVSTELFLTRKLWDAGSSAPYGHRGDLTTLTEAIDVHGGEARESRDAYFSLTQLGRDDVIDFLKSMQMLPPGTETLVVDESGASQNKLVREKGVQGEVAKRVQMALGSKPALASLGGVR